MNKLEFAEKSKQKWSAGAAQSLEKLSLAEGLHLVNLSVKT